MKFQSIVKLQWLNAAAKINASRGNFKEKLEKIYPARQHRERWNNSKQQESNTAYVVVSVFVCLWMCCLCTYLTHTRETNTDRMTGQDVKRKLSFSSCTVAVGLRRLWASLSIITAHDPSVHRATWPESPGQAPMVFLHMPDLSIRDTALSKEIHCIHEQQAEA